MKNDAKIKDLPLTSEYAKVEPEKQALFLEGCKLRGGNLRSELLIVMYAEHSEVRQRRS